MEKQTFLQLQTLVRTFSQMAKEETAEAARWAEICSSEGRWHKGTAMGFRTAAQALRNILEDGCAK